LSLLSAFIEISPQSSEEGLGTRCTQAAGKTDKFHPGFAVCGGELDLAVITGRIAVGRDESFGEYPSHLLQMMRVPYKCVKNCVPLVTAGNTAEKHNDTIKLPWI
jgi:hypothetical protein